MFTALIVLTTWLPVGRAIADDQAKTEEKTKPELSATNVEKKVLKSNDLPASAEKTAKEDEEETEAPPAPSPEKKLPETFKELYLDQLQQIISKLEEHYPLLLEKLTAEDRNRLIQEFIRSFHAGIEYHPRPLAENGEDKSADSKEVEIFPGVMIAKNKIFYLRLDGFTQKTVARLRED